MLFAGAKAAKHAGTRPLNLAAREANATRRNREATLKELVFNPAVCFASAPVYTGYRLSMLELHQDGSPIIIKTDLKTGCREGEHDLNPDVRRSALLLVVFY